MQLSGLNEMVVIVTDEAEGALEDIKEFFTTNSLKLHILPIERFNDGLKDNVNLIIYNTYSLSSKDVENIHLARRCNTPLLLITAYPENRAVVEEISKLWRYNFIEDYLIRPVKLEKLAEYLPNTNKELKVVEGGDS